MTNYTWTVPTTDLNTEYLPKYIARQRISNSSEASPKYGEPVFYIWFKHRYFAFYNEHRTWSIFSLSAKPSLCNKQKMNILTFQSACYHLSDHWQKFAVCIVRSRFCNGAEWISDRLCLIFVTVEYIYVFCKLLQKTVGSTKQYVCIKLCLECQIIKVSTITHLHYSIVEIEFIESFVICTGRIWRDMY